MEADLSADMAGLAFIGASLEGQRASRRIKLYRGRKAICLGASALSDLLSESRRLVRDEPAFQVQTRAQPLCDSSREIAMW
jgi:hypothetical protein